MKKSTLNSMVSVIDAAFKEEDHPRGDDGKFTSGGGGSSIKKSAGANKSSKWNFDLGAKQKSEALELLKHQSESFSGPVAKISSFLHGKISKGSSAGEALNAAKAKWGGKGEKEDSMLVSFYTACKGPQWNDNFSKEYSGKDYRARKTSLENEAEEWLKS